MTHDHPSPGALLLRVCLYALLALALPASYADDDHHKSGDEGGTGGRLSITKATWKAGDHKLKIKGKHAGRRARVTLRSAASGVRLAQVRADKKGQWKLTLKNPSFVPCSVQAESDGGTAVRKVSGAPADCDGAVAGGNGDGNGGGDGHEGDGGNGAGGGNGNGGSNPPPVIGAFRVLAFNDLGMHCADQDFREFSILPPYNVLNAQVVQQGGSPRLMTPADGIGLTYEAVASNIVDPASPNSGPVAMNSITSTAQNTTGIYKTNFWDATVSGDAVGFLAYQSFYPPGVLAGFPFEPDLGLPAPDLWELYLGGGSLQAEQAAMPGKSGPYSANVPQPFKGYYSDLPFFVNFPFGYTVNGLNRFTAEGIPMSMVDDQGRDNAYPLLRVTAHDGNGQALASTDTVVPTASEADCQICHASQPVCNFDSVHTLACDDIANMNYPGVPFIEDASGVIGATPEQQVINAAKINILRLHDHKHGTHLAPDNPDGTNADGSTPNVVCARCHYSPALDLAHLGPNAEQKQHVSMSRAMHGFHGRLPQSNPADYGHLFPIMPPPDGRTPQTQAQVLQDTCYNCHPGKRTRCLRGAMANGGMVCQDCHGQLTQVGEDFSGNLPNNPGALDLARRVPWASEPKCQSCHVGDVLQAEGLRLGGQLADAIVNRTDTGGTPDGIRLRMAYRVSDHKANGGPDALTLLDFPNSRFASDRPLYRLSGNSGSGKGHHGIACEGCHGSTHAIWPNANPWANDNKAAMQIQGHAGPITECSSCHSGDLGVTLEGPHGMHPVGDTRFAHDHEHLAKQNKDACRACHGKHGEGSVLSRTAAARTLQTDDHGSVQLAEGTPVTCDLCHSNKL